jgi:hypothetical protein
MFIKLEPSWNIYVYTTPLKKRKKKKKKKKKRKGNDMRKQKRTQFTCGEGESEGWTRASFLH